MINPLLHTSKGKPECTREQLGVTIYIAYIFTRQFLNNFQKAVGYFVSHVLNKLCKKIFGNYSLGNTSIALVSL